MMIVLYVHLKLQSLNLLPQKDPSADGSFYLIKSEMFTKVPTKKPWALSVWSAQLFKILATPLPFPIQKNSHTCVRDSFYPIPL